MGHRLAWRFIVERPPETVEQKTEDLMPFSTNGDMLVRFGLVVTLASGTCL
jgi:hypothetical protein